MFSKKPTTPVPTSSAPSIALPAVLANPYVGAVGAGGLLIVAAVALIGVLGDPRAGAPLVKVPLGSADAAPPGWQAALNDTGQASLDAEGVFTLFEEAPDVGPDEPITGHAMISGPGGAAPLAGQPLPAAPIAGLSQPGPGGTLLPVISPDGRTPAQAYARPFHPNGRPKVAVVIGGLGLNPTYTRQAIEQLPADVTLSFAPYPEGLQGWIDLARAFGHEVLLEAPMEPLDYPDNDPGAYTLMAAGRPEETARRTEWILGRATGYFGVTNYLGSRFVTSDSGMNAFTQTLKGRGLAFIDDGSAARRGGGLPRASADRIIDDQMSGEAIARQLRDVEAAASQRGQALGAGFAYPVTLSQVKAWTEGLAARGFQLAPASALTARR